MCSQLVIVFAKNNKVPIISSSIEQIKTIDGLKVL
jgi:hypothetical protein